MKQPDQGRKWLSMSKKMNRSQLVRSIQLEVKALQKTISTTDILASAQLIQALTQKLAHIPGITSTVAGKLLSANYWKVHDVSTNNTVNRVWVQYAMRQQEYGVRSALSSMKHTHTAIAYIAMYAALASLCGHDYDVIRNTAIGTVQVLI